MPTFWSDSTFSCVENCSGWFYHQFGIFGEGIDVSGMLIICTIIGLSWEISYWGPRSRFASVVLEVGKCFPTRSMSITWTLVRNADSQAHPRSSESETLQVRASIYGLTSSLGVSDLHSSLRTTVPCCRGEDNVRMRPLVTGSCLDSCTQEGPCVYLDAREDLMAEYPLVPQCSV